MKVHYNSFKVIVGIVLLVLNVQSTQAQTLFTESMGSPSASPTSIAANAFQNRDTLSYSNGGQTSADIRTTNVSSGYSGASGGGNIWFTSTSGSYGFSIEGINASSYSSLSLEFGYRKESASAHASFSVDYWNGTSWITVANTATALFSQTASATAATWYVSKTLPLPSGALINGLKIRFVKTGLIAIRIDDVRLKDPAFNQVAPICSGASLSPLPTTTSSGITGTWSPALNNTATTTYTFTPDQGQNALSTNMTIVINPLPTATISGSTSTCVNFPASIITFTGSNGTSNYKFTYSINNGNPLTVTSPVGSATATITVPTSTARTDVYTLLSVEDVSTTCSQTQTGTASVTVDVCTALIASLRGITLGDLNQVLSVTAVAGATTYRYGITNNATGIESIYDRTDSNRTLISLDALQVLPASPLQTITYGTTYTIRVAVNNGNYVWGPSYIVNTPANVPVTNLSTKYCGSQLTSLNETIFTNAIFNANRYKFKVNGGGIVDEQIVRNGNGLILTLLTQTPILFNTEYTVQVQASVDGGVTYPTNYGLICSVFTPIAVPTAPIVSLPTATSLKVTIGTDLNPTSTVTYAIFETTTGSFVQANGTLGINAVYQDAATWGTKAVLGLSPITLYTFRVTAKNSRGLTTVAGASASGTTLNTPSITTSNTLSALSTTYGTASSFTSFSFTAANLIGTVKIDAPIGFEVSMIPGGTNGYAASQVITPSAGAIAATTIYVRLATTTGFGAYSGNITLVSTNDGLTVNVPTVESSVAKRELTVTGITVLNKVFDGTTVAALNGTAILNGVLPNDSSNVILNAAGVTAAFTDAAIGEGKAVTVSGYALSGSASSNYNLIQPSGLTANITANASSDIVFNTGSTTSDNTNINYSIYQGTTLTSTQSGTNGSLGVMGFHLRDGGAVDDADNLNTELTAITFNVTNPNNILRRARLFIGNSVRGIPVEVSDPDPINGISTITFTNLTNIIATDNNQLAINLRVTFRDRVVDNEQLQFTITNVTANAAGSQFANPNGGGASSSVTGNINRIEVTVSTLSFLVQPIDSYVGTNMSQSPTVEARDNFGNRDLDATVFITSSGNLDNSPQTASTSSGLATFNSINHTTHGSELHLTATADGIQNPAISNTFTINPLILPTFDPVAPICMGGVLNSLPMGSTNEPPIAGLWAPPLNNNATTEYTFTPNAGQNATTTKLTIEVTTPPSAGNLSGANDVSIGSTTPFTSSTTGGTWSSSDPNIATIGETTGIITGVSIGSTNITYSVSGTGGCTGATSSKTITILQIAVDTTAPTFTCPTAQGGPANDDCEAIVPNFISGIIALDDVTPTSSLIITQSPPAGTAVSMATTDVNITVTDAANNSSSCIIKFTPY